MPHVIFIFPSIGRYPGMKYVRSWQMQPLGIAVLSALTPESWTRSFYDDRLEEIDYSEAADLVAVSIETYTARRGYQIAEEYKKKGIPVIIGGFHATACPDEVLEYADSVCVGEAEGVWDEILSDAEKGMLKKKYVSQSPKHLQAPLPDRSIFQDKRYFKIAMVESGRGCGFHCSFCSISSFYGSSYRRRNTRDIINEIKAIPDQTIFFIDDNIIGNIKSAKELFCELIPLKISWISQASVNAADDPSLLSLMKQSGCIGLLIGFESLDSENLHSMNKEVNRKSDFTQALARIRNAGLLVYGTFIFGYGGDTEEMMKQTVSFAVKEKIYIAAFAHLVPFPGTPLYRSLEESGRLLKKKWWL
ncbi:MAG: B12-binding domain-containing radical SAM protein, partial [Spirochaetia bacterium]|nr:B12-binding domain-containing radical SAM protein [Spirochaetia bacterium]